MPDYLQLILAFSAGFLAFPLCVTAVFKWSEWRDARDRRRGRENWMRDQERNGDLG